MKENQKTNKFKEIVDSHPLTIIISIVIFTVGVTSAVFIFDRNNLIMYHNLIIENYKLENQRLEKIIDQRDKISNLDSIASSLRNLLSTQTKIIESKHSINEFPNNPKKSIQKWKSLINKANSGGVLLLKLDPSENKTYELYNNWRNDCLALLNQIDSEFSTKYMDNFSTLTKLDISDYQLLKTKVNDGLSIIKIIEIL